MNNNIEIPKIHGKAEITLKNVKTGLVKKINSENVFQPTVLQHFLKQNSSLTDRTPFYTTNSNDFLNYILYYADGYSVCRSLVGGIFLFQNTITTGTEYMPAGNKMIGCGCREFINNTNVTEMGSFSASESEINLNNGIITQTWDFNTSQANGTTRCISLTSARGARMGYGNACNIGLTDVYTSGYAVETLVPLLQNDKGGFLFNNIEYVFDLPDADTFRVRKYKKGINQLSIFNSRLMDTITFDLATIGKGNMAFSSYRDRFYPYSFWYLGNGIFRFASTNYGTSTQDVANGSQWYYYEYSVTNNTLTLKSFINTTGETLSGSGDSYAFLRGDKVFIRSSSTTNRSILIDLTDNSIIKVFDENIPIHNTGNIAGDENLILYYRYGTGSARIYDVINDTNYITNEYNSGNTTRVLGKRQWDENMYGYYGLADYYWYERTKMERFFKEPRYLATINNLSTPIEKTNAHTLKVTYTLEEV